MSHMIISILLYVGSLFILYIVIETAVRRGINSSIIGQALEKSLEFKKKRKNLFFNRDLDGN